MLGDYYHHHHHHHPYFTLTIFFRVLSANQVPHLTRKSTNVITTTYDCCGQRGQVLSVRRGKDFLFRKRNKWEELRGIDVTLALKWWDHQRSFTAHGINLRIK
ncbi:hypothetical protein Fcan01_12650 [Folsomia candida]|uniref:Uncharacterized protein n=1 Tax=Folsomia candida TaxID=158441 RepID=A0A226E776_FOLCA|nr:hypothetical protein Fcan01_12650 [Folsomia candida]